VSEQDFFFDDEPEAKGPSAKAPAAKAPSARSPKAPVASPAKVSAAAPDDQSTTWAIAALIGVIGLLLGAILGFVLGTTLAGKSATVAATPAPAVATQVAPQLTTQQINAGQLPAGHPAIPTTSVATTPTK
jgi:hypothetical protein